MSYAIYSICCLTLASCSVQDTERQPDEIHALIAVCQQRGLLHSVDRAGNVRCAMYPVWYQSHPSWDAARLKGADSER